MSEWMCGKILMSEEKFFCISIGSLLLGLWIIPGWRPIWLFHILFSFTPTRSPPPKKKKTHWLQLYISIKFYLAHLKVRKAENRWNETKKLLLCCYSMERKGNWRKPVAFQAWNVSLAPCIFCRQYLSVYACYLTY